MIIWLERNKRDKSMFSIYSTPRPTFGNPVYLIATIHEDMIGELFDVDNEASDQLYDDPGPVPLQVTTRLLTDGERKGVRQLQSSERTKR